MKKASPRAMPTAKSILADAGWALLFVVIMILAKMAFEHSGIRFAEWMVEFTESVQERRLIGYDQALPLNAVVVDLSSVPQLPVAPDSPQLATPPDKLLEAVKAIVEARPSGIAIDIDYSSLDGKPKHPGNPQLLKDFQALTTETKVPIFVGVYDARMQPKSAWLGEGLDSMAAGMVIPYQSFRAHYEFHNAHGDVLPGMAQRLASAQGFNEPPEIPGLSWALEFVEHRHTKSGDVVEFVSDLSPLQRLIDSTVHTMRPDALRDYASKFTGKLVIIGDADRGDDKFTVPGLTAEPVAGAYLHACAAITAAGDYLWHVSHLGRLCMDGLIAGLILAIVSAVRFWSLGRREWGALNHEFLDRLLTILAAVVVWFIAYPMVGKLRIIWTDFILLAISLLIHHPVHHATHRGWHWLSRWFHHKMFPEHKSNQP